MWTYHFSKNKPARNWRLLNLMWDTHAQFNVELSQKRERTVWIVIEKPSSFHLLNEPALLQLSYGSSTSQLQGQPISNFATFPSVIKFSTHSDETGPPIVIFCACMWSLVNSIRLIQEFIYWANIGSLLKCVWCHLFCKVGSLQKHKQQTNLNLLYKGNDARVSTLTLTVAHCWRSHWAWKLLPWTPPPHQDGALV